MRVEYDFSEGVRGKYAGPSLQHQCSEMSQRLKTFSEDLYGYSDVTKEKAFELSCNLIEELEQFQVGLLTGRRYTRG